MNIVVDKMMIHYKNSYCSIHQYMLNQIKKMEIESLVHHMFCFQIHLEFQNLLR